MITAILPRNGPKRVIATGHRTGNDDPKSRTRPLCIACLDFQGCYAKGLQATVYMKLGKIITCYHMSRVRIVFYRLAITLRRRILPFQ
jgi:hypothetical protein